MIIHLVASLVPYVLLYYFDIQVIGVIFYLHIYFQDLQCIYLQRITPLLHEIETVRGDLLSLHRSMNCALANIDSSHERLQLENQALKQQLMSLHQAVLDIFLQYETVVAA